MPEKEGRFTESAARELQAMVKQWRGNGRRFTKSGVADHLAGLGTSPIVHALEITSATADADGYPARIQEWDGTTWTDTYTECRAVKIGGGTLATGFYPPGVLKRVTSAGMHVYGLHPGAAGVTPFSGNETGTNYTTLAADDVWEDTDLEEVVAAGTYLITVHAYVRMEVNGGTGQISGRLYDIDEAADFGELMLRESTVTGVDETTMHTLTIVYPAPQDTTIRFQAKRNSSGTYAAAAAKGYRMSVVQIV